MTLRSLRIPYAIVALGALATATASSYSAAAGVGTMAPTAAE
jgi:hypothetical protein